MAKTHDLEDKIMSAWNILEDVKLLANGVMEREMTPDQIANILIGIEGIYTMRFEQLWETFTEALREHYNG